MITTVTVRALVVGYDERRVAAVGSFDLTAERVTLVIGPNGAGKTTLLKTLAGLLRPLEGSISPRPAAGPEQVVYVHTVPFLFAGSVRRNLLLASRGREAPARGALDALGVGNLWLQTVGSLSAGQRQRVALARALAADPALLIVDEPEGGLDAQAIDLWRRVMQQAIAARHPIVVMAAHRPVAVDAVPTQTIALCSA